MMPRCWMLQDVGPQDAQMLTDLRNYLVDAMENRSRSPGLPAVQPDIMALVDATMDKVNIEAIRLAAQRTQQPRL